MAFSATLQGQRAYQSPPQPPNSSNSSQQTPNSNSSSGGGGGRVGSGLSGGSTGATDQILSNHHSATHESNNMQIASSPSLIGPLGSATVHAGMVQQQSSAATAAADQRRPSAKAPHPSQPLKCPRCESLDTKFCYYNNYSLTQPRYFCKNCKRYWTAGGALRNVPVGGGLRKNKRTKLKLAAAAAASPSEISADSIAAAHAFSSKPTIENSAIRRVPDQSKVPTPPPLLSGSAIPAPSSLSGIDPSPTSLYNQLQNNRIRQPPNEIAAIADSAAGLDYSSGNSTVSVVDQNGCPMPSVFYGADPRQFYATAPSSLICDPVTVSGQQMGGMAENASSYGGMNSFNFLMPPSSASFRHQIDGNHHSVDGSSNPMLNTISLCSTSDQNSVAAMIKQERAAAAAAAAAASVSCDDQITATTSSSTATASGSNPYDWQMISDGLFNSGSDGFLYQLPGSSSWPDFSDQFNDTGPG